MKIEDKVMKDDQSLVMGITLYYIALYGIVGFIQTQTDKTINIPNSFLGKSVLTNARNKGIISSKTAFTLSQIFSKIVSGAELRRNPQLLRDAISASEELAKTRTPRFPRVQSLLSDVSLGKLPIHVFAKEFYILCEKEDSVLTNKFSEFISPWTSLLNEKLKNSPNALKSVAPKTPVAPILEPTAAPVREPTPKVVQEAVDNNATIQQQVKYAANVIEKQEDAKMTKSETLAFKFYDSFVKGNLAMTKFHDAFRRNTFRSTNNVMVADKLTSLLENEEEKDKFLNVALHKALPKEVKPIVEIVLADLIQSGYYSDEQKKRIVDETNVSNKILNELIKHQEVQEESVENEE